MVIQSSKAGHETTLLLMQKVANRHGGSMSSLSCSFKWIAWLCNCDHISVGVVASVSIEKVLGDCVIAVDDVQSFVVYGSMRGMSDRASTR